MNILVGAVGLNILPYEALNLRQDTRQSKENCARAARANTIVDAACASMTDCTEAPVSLFRGKCECIRGI